MEYSGTNLKNPKKILGQTLKSRAKKELLFPFLKIVTLKKEPYE